MQYMCNFWNFGQWAASWFSSRASRPMGLLFFKIGLLSEVSSACVCGQHEHATGKRSNALMFFTTLQKSLHMWEPWHGSRKQNVLVLTTVQDIIFCHFVESNTTDWIKGIHTFHAFLLSKINSGLLQGSVFGPMFIPGNLHKWPVLHYSLQYSKAILVPFAVPFADDTSTYYSSKNLTTLFKNINSDLTQVEDWFRANKLLLKFKKKILCTFSPTN